MTRISDFLRRSVALWLLVAVVGLLSPALAKGGADKPGKGNSGNSYGKGNDNRRDSRADDKGGVPARLGVKEDRSNRGGNSYGNRRDGRFVVFYGKPVDVEQQWFAWSEPSGVRYSFAHGNVFWFGMPYRLMRMHGNWRPWNQGRGPR